MTDFQQTPDDTALATRLLAWEAEAGTLLADEVKTASAGHDFYAGKQWESDVLKTLQAEGRPALTINHIRPTVDAQAGEMVQNPRDIKAFPLKGSADTAAKVVSALIKHALEKCNGHAELSEAFRMGCVGNKGWVLVDVVPGDYGDEKRIVVAYNSQFLVVEDGLCTTYDVNKGGRFVIVYEWHERDELRATYPQIADIPESGADGILRRAYSYAKDALVRLMSGDSERTIDVDSRRSQRQLLVKRFFWKEYEAGAWVVDAMPPTPQDARVWMTGEAEIAKAEELALEDPMRFSVRRQVRKVMNEARIIGAMVIEKAREPLGDIDLFPAVRFVPHFTDGLCQGVTDDIQGPQQEENKRRSALLHQQMQTANSGWMMESGSTDRKHLEEFGSKTGVVIEYAKGSQPPQKIQPNQIAAGLHELANMAANDIREISGVNAERLGYESKSGTPARALALQQRQGATVTAPIVANWDYTLRLLGQLMVPLVCRPDIYSDEEIKAIIDRDEMLTREIAEKAQGLLAEQGMMPPEPVQPPMAQDMAGLAQAAGMAGQDAQAAQGKVMQAFQQKQAAFQQAAAQYEAAMKQAVDKVIIDQIRDVRTAQYGITVGQSAAAPTQRMAQFQELVELAKAFPGSINPADIVRASDLPNREELARNIVPPQALPQQGGGMPSPAQMGG